MASTSMSLGKHWEKFLKDKVKSGQYGSASEVVREALRGLEDRERMLDSVKAFVTEGLESGSAGALNIREIINEAKQEQVKTNADAA